MAPRADGPRPINLDAFVAEAAGTPIPVELRGETYELPPEFPVATVLLFQQEKPYEGLRVLFGAEGVDRLLSSVPDLTIPGIQGLLMAVASEVYGLDLPESPASGSSSPAPGKPSRPTSSRRTKST